MNWRLNWPRRGRARPTAPAARPPFRPQLEALEGRQVPSTTGVVSSVLDAHGNPAVFAIAGSDHSLWEYYPAVINPAGPSTSHWAEVSAGSFAAVSATLDDSGAPAAFAIVSGDRSLWEYNSAVFGPATGYWAQVSPGSFATISAAPGDGAAASPEPAVFAVVNGDHSLWEYDTAFAPWNPAQWHWVEVSAGSFTAVSAATVPLGQKVAFGIVGGDSSLWAYDPVAFGPGGPADGHWAQVSPGSFTAVSAATVPLGQKVAFGIVGGDSSLWAYDPVAFGPGGPADGHWAQVSPGSFTAVSAAFHHSGSFEYPVAFATASDQSVWKYDPIAYSPAAPPNGHWGGFGYGYDVTASNVAGGDLVVFKNVLVHTTVPFSEDLWQLWEWNPVAPADPFSGSWHSLTPPSVHPGWVGGTSVRPFLSACGDANETDPFVTFPGGGMLWYSNSVSGEVATQGVEASPGPF